VPAGLIVDRDGLLYDSQRDWLVQLDAFHCRQRGEEI
jgi:hypothetical protein